MERSQIEYKFSPMVLDGFDFSDTSQVNGSVIIRVEHPDVSESYNQSFSITTPDIPDQFVTNYDFNDGANGWTETNSPDVSVSSSIADIDYTGETSAGLLQTMELSVEGQYEIEVRGSTNDGAQQQKTTIRDSSSRDYLSANISNFDRVDIFSTSLETKSDTFQVDDSGSVEVRVAANYRADCRVDYVSIKYIG